MTDICTQHRDRIAGVLARLVADGRLPAMPDEARIVVDPPKDPSHGHLSTGVAMAIAKGAGMAPRAIAELVAGELRTDPDIARVDVAGPGFVNVFLKPAVLHEVLKEAIVAGSDFGRLTVREDAAVMVEYVSANPTGPMHVGHGRGAVVGDALASLLAFAGAKVFREYYVNDAGAQVDVLARSVAVRYREALGEPASNLDGLYPGEYLVPLGQSLAREHGRAFVDRSESEWLPVFRKAAVAAMMEMIREDLALLGVRHDGFFSELSLTTGPDGDLVAAAIEDLRARGLVHVGRLPPPKGKLPDDWEDREQTLFRSTLYGDDVDRALLKSDGSPTYFASDIAYHRSKWQRGWTRLIDVLGADHGGYVKRMAAAVKAVSNGEATFEAKTVQLVSLLRDGQPVRMSKRAGSLVMLREVAEEVGSDAFRFELLFRKADAQLAFDLARVVEQAKANPVFYVQYAHTRCEAAFRQAAEVMGGLDLSPEALCAADLALLVDEGEQQLLRVVADWPRFVREAAAAGEPHRITHFLYDFAGHVHAQWTRGNRDASLRFARADDPATTLARLALVRGVAGVFKAGLGILGVGAPSHMQREPDEEI